MITLHINNNISMEIIQQVMDFMIDWIKTGI